MNDAIKGFEDFHDSNEEEDFSISNTKVLTDHQLRGIITRATNVQK